MKFEERAARDENFERKSCLPWIFVRINTKAFNGNLHFFQSFKDTIQCR